MKKSIFGTIAVACLLLISYSCATDIPKDLVIIDGTFTNPVTAPVVLQGVEGGKVVDISSAKVDANGHFVLALHVTEPGFYILDYGQMNPYKQDQLIRLYLEPGLNMQMTVNKSDYTLAGKIGKNAVVQQANQLYNTYTKYSRPNGKELRFQPVFKFWTETGVPAAKKLSESISSNDSNFNKLMKLSIEADLEVCTYMYFRYPSATHPTKSDLPAFMASWVTADKFNDEAILKLFNGLDWMSSYYMHNDMLFADQRPAGQIEFLTQTTQEIKDPVLQEAYVINEISKAHLNSDRYLELKASIGSAITSDAGKAFIFEYEKKINKEVGRKGVNFSYPDINGKPVSLSQFKGKFVYVDMWATWCAPCKKELPSLMKLEKEFHGKDVVFIGVSLDKPADKSKWMNYVKENKLGGYQVMADKEFKSILPLAYQVKTIPRFLLFDREGKVIDADALRPSNPKLKVQLTNLLKQK